MQNIFDYQQINSKCPLLPTKECGEYLQCRFLGGTTKKVRYTAGVQRGFLLSLLFLHYDLHRRDSNICHLSCQPFQNLIFMSRAGSKLCTQNNKNVKFCTQNNNGNNNYVKSHSLLVMFNV